MADKYCKYCERENDDCLMRCAGWRDTAALRNQLQVQEIELDITRGRFDRAMSWIRETHSPDHYDRALLKIYPEGEPTDKEVMPDAPAPVTPAE